MDKSRNLKSCQYPRIISYDRFFYACLASFMGVRLTDNKIRRSANRVATKKSICFEENIDTEEESSVFLPHSLPIPTARVSLSFKSANDRLKEPDWITCVLFFRDSASLIMMLKFFSQSDEISQWTILDN